MSRALSSLLAAALLLALPSVAEAGNSLHPRTPVDWSGAPCMTIIDRSQGPIFPLVYAIPYEDTEVTPDEVEQSRTHQFFAFCRDHHREELNPSWITEADLMDADAHGLGDASAVDAELEVLENAPEWADCWVRINGDDERRPITFESAAEPVPWDTSALPAGTYALEGYTYEPWANEWWPHPGVFKIVDDPDPAASGPAAALTFPEQIVEHGDAATITGCIDAMEGTTVTASWALSGFGSEPQWHEFASGLSLPSGELELSFAPPSETISNTVLIKLEVEDPQGRRWTAHANNYIAVTESFGSDDDACDEGGSFVSDPCQDEQGEDEGEDEQGEEESSASEGDPSSESGPGAQDEGGGGSCNCSSGSSGSSSPWWTLGLGLLALGRLSSRRRRGINDHR
ncbi:MAG: MYXO-CTERM sorting domain-containing protein [Enhygromyxa sp.]